MRPPGRLRRPLRRPPPGPRSRNRKPPLFRDARAVGGFVHELSDTLGQPAFLQKISLLGPSDYFLVFRGKVGRLALYLSLKAGRPGLWLWAREKPQAQVPSAFLMLVRKHCQGKPLAVRQPTPDRLLRLEFTSVWLWIELVGRQPNMILTRPDGKVLGGHRGLRPGSLYVPPEPPPASEDGELRPGVTEKGQIRADGSAETACTSFLEASQISLERVFPASHFAELVDQKGQLEASLRRLLVKNQRHQANLTEDMARVERAEELQHHADLLMAHAHALRKGERQAVVPDWDGVTLVTIPLDPALDARAQAALFYKRAAKFRRAVPILQERLEHVRGQERWLGELRLALEQAEGEAELAELRAQMESQPAPKKRSGASPRAAGPRRYRLGEFDILVGRNPRQNEELLTRHGQRQDLWLHAKEGPGSHVLVRLNGRVVDGEALWAAACLAARFSTLRNDTRVRVAYTTVSKVKKVAGGAPGLVTYRDEQTIVVDPRADIPDLTQI